MPELPTLKTQSDAVIFFISQLDIDMIDDLLDDRNYQELSKSQFITKLSTAFDQLRAQGNTILNLIFEPCQYRSCYMNCYCIIFQGDKSNHFLELIFETDKGRVTDIYECEFFTNRHLKEIDKMRIDIGINYYANPPF